ncbi:MAG: sigma-70 family RNA polymerase sigma factor [Lewinellaceae bacterium]|nr:sigma-70 family RNA polymerase sigma factor [Lewinellaceae bacterium]
MQVNQPSDQFIALLEANKGLLYKVANAYCKDAEDRRDLIQEITLQLWRSFDKYDPQYQLSTWIYRIALNVSISFYRKSSAHSAYTQGLPPGIIENIPAADAENHDPNLVLLQRFIQELKEIDKALILLYLDEKSQKEISEILGLSNSNVSTKIARIKTQLKAKFSSVKN